MKNIKFLKIPQIRSVIKLKDKKSLSNEKLEKQIKKPQENYYYVGDIKVERVTLDDIDDLEI